MVASAAAADEEEDEDMCIVSLFHWFSVANRVTDLIRCVSTVFSGCFSAARSYLAQRTETESRVNHVSCVLVPAFLCWRQWLISIRG